MRRGVLVSFAAVGGMLCLCGDPTVIKFSPGYSFDSRGGQVTCAIVLPDEIRVDYQGNVEEEFGPGETGALISNFFRKQIAKDIKAGSIFNLVYNSSAVNSYPRESLDLETDDGDFRFSLPKAGEKVECQDGTPTVVIFMGDVSITSNFEMSASPGTYVHTGFGPGYHTGGSFSSSKNLIIKARFAIWDNQAGVLASHGYVRVVDENSFAVSKDDWLAAVSELASKILAGTPFSRQPM